MGVINTLPEYPAAAIAREYGGFAGCPRLVVDCTCAPGCCKAMRDTLIEFNPIFVDWVLGTIYNPTEHDDETQTKKFYPQIWG